MCILCILILCLPPIFFSHTLTSRLRDEQSQICRSSINNVKFTDVLD